MKTVVRSSSDMHHIAIQVASQGYQGRFNAAISLHSLVGPNLESLSELMGIKIPVKPCNLVPEQG